SSDATVAVARQLGCPVLELPLHLGYGGALQAGIKYGLRRGYPVVVTFDGDGQHDPADVAALVGAVEAGADVAIGSRLTAPGAYRGTPIRQAGRRLFAGLVRML